MIEVWPYIWAIGSFVGLLAGLAVLLTVAERLLVNYGICEVDINAGEHTLEIEGGQTLLNGLMESKIFIPSACGGQGSCGHCKIVVLDGGGPVLPTETPFLTRAETRGNVRLACQVKIREDVRVTIPEDLLSVQMFSATVASTTVLTHDIKELRFSLNEPAEISQRPGQYIQVPS